ncbi:heparinase II/III family protein [Muriicola marianensis]|uniref:Heparin-sulfate lyase N-terminal domain-containing protein n=1 Tax=Muriicola marianensis TaxID=1324801 RepID=A0ABQ1QWG4_9FLAO|nr:heparinase II/III family protein [Muriicola marianensis]GGD49767.1 hypothetical protein GCM10011361_15570 [Muriicola marianensis]
MGVIPKIKRFLNTVKYLKPVQIRYQLYYRFIAPYLPAGIYAKREYTSSISPIRWEGGLAYKDSFLGKDRFIFLNTLHEFEKGIQWELDQYGKLWTYNLNYFDFLNQERIDPENGLLLIKDYMGQKDHRTGKEPYPTSLRGINWIKFLSKHHIVDQKVNRFLYREFVRLSRRPEYHIMGNHLLENGVSLMFAGVYFQDTYFSQKAEKILKEQLREQFLRDGAHFELSPMYHRILLHRMLDVIYLLRLNNRDEGSLYSLVYETTSRMLSWLDAVRYEDDAVPMVNDSVHGFAFNPEALFGFASRIGIGWDPIPLKESGYRKFTDLPFEVFADFGDIGPDYIPGHAHADTFNFEIYYNGSPLLVDSGTSTYAPGSRRHIERSTAAHNTVVVNDEPQSDIWGTFRVGRRAKILHFEESEYSAEGIHDGYKHLGLHHFRSLQMRDGTGVDIKDRIIRKKRTKYKADAHFHFYPGIRPSLSEEKKVVIDDLGIEILFDGDIKGIQVDLYKFATGYGNLVDAFKIRVSFSEELDTRFIHTRPEKS